jgi:hypothetical protein
MLSRENEEDTDIAASEAILKDLPLVIWTWNVFLVFFLVG